MTVARYRTFALLSTRSEPAIRYLACSRWHCGAGYAPIGPYQSGSPHFPVLRFGAIIPGERGTTVPKFVGDENMAGSADYRAIFAGVESTLIQVANGSGRGTDIRGELNDYKTYFGRTLTDHDYFQTMVQVAFYSGFKAATVDSHLAAIDSYFSDYDQVADYGAPEIAKMLADPEMIHHEGKIRGCIENAKELGPS